MTLQNFAIHDFYSHHCNHTFENVVHLPYSEKALCTHDKNAFTALWNFSIFYETK